MIKSRRDIKQLLTGVILSGKRQSGTYVTSDELVATLVQRGLPTVSAPALGSYLTASGFPKKRRWVMRSCFKDHPELMANEEHLTRPVNEWSVRFVAGQDGSSSSQSMTTPYLTEFTYDTSDEHVYALALVFAETSDQAISLFLQKHMGTAPGYDSYSTMSARVKTLDVGNEGWSANRDQAIAWLKSVFSDEVGGSLYKAHEDYRLREFYVKTHMVKSISTP